MLLRVFVGASGCAHLPHGAADDGPALGGHQQHALEENHGEQREGAACTAHPVVVVGRQESGGGVSAHGRREMWEREAWEVSRPRGVGRLEEGLVCG